MEEKIDGGEELYSHHGVMVKSHTPVKQEIDYLHTSGTLSIVEYNDSDKFIEWRHTEVSVVSDIQDQEWAVVHEMKGRERTISENSTQLKPPNIQVSLKLLRSFRLSKNSQQLSLFQTDGTSSSVFYFQNGNANMFVEFLKSIINTELCSTDRSIYLVMDEPKVHNLSQSFAALDIFPDDKPGAMWKFFKNFQIHPYETTLEAFSKVTDTFLYRPHDYQEDEEVVEYLQQSLTEIPQDNRRNVGSGVTNDEYEVITRGVPLPPLTLPLRCPPLNNEQWDNFFDETGRLAESNIIKEIIFHGGVSPAIRPEVWPFLLNYYPWNSSYTERQQIRKQKADEYYQMKLQWKTMTAGQESRFLGYVERKSLIEKDVNRTDRTMSFFAGDNNPNLNTLQDILMTYVMYNFDLGYVQGMNDLLSPILVLIRDEVDSFWCFVGFMDIVCHNFDLDQAGMSEQLKHLHTLLKVVEPELASYLDLHESSNMFFCFRWLLVWFKRELSYDDTMSLWEVLWTQSLCKNFHLLVCLAILDTEKDTLMSDGYGFTEILKHINELSGKINLQAVLSKATGIYFQLSSATHLSNSVRSIIGLKLNKENETVNSESDSSMVEINGCGTDGVTLQTDDLEVRFETALSMNHW